MDKKCTCGRVRPKFVFDDDGCDFCRRNKAQREAEKSSVTLGDLRAERNRLLTDCDWTQLSDVPVNTRKKWRLYRKELRDLFDNTTDPTMVVFPTKPE